MRGRRAKLNENGDGEVDENFWAQAAAGQAAADDDQDGDESTFSGYFPNARGVTSITAGGAVPFNTQFFQDDYDDGPGFDDGFDGVGVPDTDAGEQDLLAATQGQTRRVRPETVNYAKRAKRVDVRKLKENIWKGLDIVIAKTKLDDDKEDDESMVCLFFSLLRGQKERKLTVITNRTSTTRLAHSQQTRTNLDSSARSYRVYKSRTRRTRWRRSARVSVSSAYCIWRTSRG